MKYLDKLKWKNWPLAVKLTLAMTLMITLAIATVTLLAMQREQQNFRVELEQQAQLLLKTLTEAVTDPLYYLDADKLQDMTERLVSNETLVSGRIYNPEGRIIADGHDSFLAFNLQSDPFGQQLVQSNTVIFDWQPDHLVAGQAVMLGNQRIGAVSLGLSTGPLEAKVAAVRNQGLSIAFVTVLVGLLLALLLSQSITGPLHDLVSATQQIARGNLHQEITVTTGDEVAKLGLAMDQMRAELRELYLNLEQQVAAHTAELTTANEQLRHEIAVRTQTELELRQARDHALAAIRLKAELLAKVSHELRTPLGVIVGYAEMLCEKLYGPLADEQEEPIKHIIESSQALTRQVNELLDQARFEAGKQELFKTTFALADIIEQVNTQMQVLAQAKGLTFTTKVAVDAPAILYGDPIRLQQILTNLAGNAIKFTQKGSVSISVYRLGEALWAIQVSDTGPGIPVEAQSRIFEPFWQVDGSMTREHEGIGLGLAIVRQLVTLMEGEITLESRMVRAVPLQSFYRWSRFQIQPSVANSSPPFLLPHAPAAAHIKQLAG